MADDQPNNNQAADMDTITYETIILTAQDGSTLEVPTQPMLLCGLIKDQLEDKEADDEDDNTLYFPMIPSQQEMQMVVDFCEYHATEEMTKLPQPIPDNKDLGDCVQEFYANFANIDNVRAVDLYAQTVEMNGDEYVAWQNANVASVEERENLERWEGFQPVPSFDKLTRMLKVADSLNMEPMRDLLGAQIAMLIRGKNTEWLRVVFGPDFKNDFTVEEEAEVKEEFRWID